MKKIKYFLIVFTLLLSSVLNSFSSDGREIIKAYEKGKPAKLELEVTKVRSDNFIDLFIDKSEKKIYRDISKQTRENSDLDQRLYVTTYLKPNNKSNSVDDELPHKIINIEGKRYLEITYFQEPKNIYLWVVKSGKVQKLYTGVLKEFVNPLNPITHINYSLTEKDSDKKHKVGNDYLIFKIGKIQLKNISDRDIKLTLHEEYSFKNKNLKNIPVKLYFKNNERTITLTKDNPTTDIFCYFKVENEADAFGTFHLNDLEKDSKEFSLAVDFKDSGIKMAKTSDNLLTLNDYEIMPLAIVDGNVAISTFSNPGVELQVNYQHLLFYSHPPTNMPNNIFSISGSITSAWYIFNNISKTATIEFFDNTSPITVKSDKLDALSLANKFTMTFNKNSSKLETKFTRSDANVKKVTVTMTTGLGIVTKDTIVIDYNNEEPLFGYEVTHMDFGIISTRSNTSSTAEAEIKITPNRNITCTYSFPASVEIITGGGGLGQGVPDNQKIAVSLEKTDSDRATIDGSMDVDKPNNASIKIKGTIPPSNLSKKVLGVYLGNFPVEIRATERTKGGKF